MTTNITTSLLSLAHSPSTTSQIHLTKIKSRPLHLKPTTSQDTNPRQRRQQQRSRPQHLRKPHPLSASQKRLLRVHTIPPSEQSYSIYKPLHALWTSYMQDILSLHDEHTRITAASAALLATADFHGAEIEVVRCRCVGRVGIKGIVVRDLRFAFRVVTRGGGVKLVPKEGTVFAFGVRWPVRRGRGGEGGGGEDGEKMEGGEEVEMVERKKLVFELHGDQFQFRAADRANKKFKPHFLKDL